MEIEEEEEEKRAVEGAVEWMATLMMIGSGGRRGKRRQDGEGARRGQKGC